MSDPGHDSHDMGLFLSTESDTTDAFKNILAHNVGADRISSIIESVGSDRGGDFQINGPFGAMCRDPGIKKENIPYQGSSRSTVQRPWNQARIDDCRHSRKKCSS